jgi:predicted O-methyltransferase YrrM
MNSRARTPAPFDIFIEGWATREMLAVLSRLAQGCKTIVEIGVWRGRSTIAMARVTPGRVYAVDHWRGDGGVGEVHDPLEVYSEFLGNVRRFDVQDRVVPLFMRSVEAAILPHWPPIDLLYLDADHSYSSVLADLRAWLPHLAADGIICGDDYHLSGVHQAVDEALPAQAWRIETAAGGRLFIAQKQKVAESYPAGNRG